MAVRTVVAPDPIRPTETDQVEVSYFLTVEKDGERVDDRRTAVYTLRSFVNGWQFVKLDESMTAHQYEAAIMEVLIPEDAERYKADLLYNADAFVPPATLGEVLVAVRELLSERPTSPTEN